MGGMNIRNNIARIGATALISCGLIATSVPATFAVEGAPQTVYTYADSAQFLAPDVWVEGQELNIAGEGFKTADGTSGSVLALKLNKGAVKINGQDYLEIHADEAGNFSVAIPWQAELHGSVSVDIYLLSGSLKDGDVPRGGKAATVTIKVAEQPTPEPTQDPTPEPTQDPTPEPTQDPTPEPSKEATAEPTTEAPKPADETSAPAVEDAKETKPAEDQKPTEEQKSDSEQHFRFQNCADVEAAGLAPIRKDHPDFRAKFDADGDGVGCEQPADYENSNSADDQNSGGQTSATRLSAGQNSGSATESHRFQNCADVEAAGLAPIRKDHPDFREKFDADHDGIGCEWPVDYENANASSKSSSSLAKTGASDAMTAAGLGLIALGAGGATIVATRMRKKA